MTDTVSSPEKEKPTISAGHKYVLLLNLYIAQSIPMSFFSTVLPVIMRMEKYSLASIGMIQLVKLPWIIKFLWGPVVDRNGNSDNHYKKWIISSELFYAIVIISIGFFSLQSSFSTILILMVIAFTLSATQDIASDALAIRILKKKERSMGNSMQSSGNFLGTLFGSGVLLWVYSKAGWQAITFLLGGIVIVTLLPLILYRNKSVDQPLVNRKNASFKDILTFFKIPAIGKRILLLLFYYAGILGILTMLKPWLVDLGYSVAEIAFMSGILGTGIGAASALLGGLLLRKLGNKRSLFIIAVYNLLVASFFAFISTGTPSVYLIYIAIILLWSGYAMAAVNIFTVSMNTVRKGREGTDYTIQIVLTHLSGILISVMSGKTAGALGYNGLFMIEACIALVIPFLVVLLYSEPDINLSISTKQKKFNKQWKLTRS